MLLRRARDSALGSSGTRNGGREAGMDTDEAESKGLEIEAAPALQGSNDLIRSGVDAGTGTSVGVGAGAGASNDAVDKVSAMSGSVHGATISRCVVPSIE